MSETVKARLPVVERRCGVCTACCTLVGVSELAKPPGKACVHLTVAPDARGCGRYKTRPAGCRTFACLWLLGALDDWDDRPNILGVMLDAYRLDDGSTGVVAREVAPGGFERARGRLGAFARKSVGLVPSRPVIVVFADGRREAFDGETLGPIPFEFREE